MTADQVHTGKAVQAACALSPSEAMDPQPQHGAGVPTTGWVRFQEVTVGAIACVALLLCLWNIVMRTVNHNWVLDISDEAQIYLIVWALLMSLGMVTRDDRHIRADLFVRRFSPIMRKFAFILAELLGLAFSVAMVIAGATITWEAWSFGDVSTTTMRFPMWIYIASLPVGSLLMTVSYLLRLKDMATGRYRWTFSDEVVGT